MPLYQKSLALTYPGNIPDEFFRHFLRGVCDGDGNVSISKSQRVVQGKTKYYFTTRLRVLGTKDFLAGLTKAIDRLIGIAPVKVQPKAKERIWYIEYHGKSADAILEEVYRNAEFFIERKYRVWRYIKENAHKLPKIFGKPEGRLNYRAKMGTL